MQVIFELTNVYFSYLGKFPALNGLDIRINEGQKVTIVGANGSGKSTLLHLLDGLVFADKGRVSFGGTELNEKVFNDEIFARNFRSQVGFVFQNPDVQLFCPTVKEDIVFGPLQLGLGKPEIQRRLDKLVVCLGIQNLLDRQSHQLSIGEKRKVALASTLISDPQVLLLDEPTAGLDPLTTRSIIDLLFEESGNKRTIITSTHDLHIVDEISDVVYVLDSQKKVTRFGAPEDILNDTALLQENNLVHIHRHRHKGQVHQHPHTHWEHHSDPLI